MESPVARWVSAHDRALVGYSDQSARRLSFHPCSVSRRRRIAQVDAQIDVDSSQGRGPVCGSAATNAAGRRRGTPYRTSMAYMIFVAASDYRSHLKRARSSTVPVSKIAAKHARFSWQ